MSTLLSGQLNVKKGSGLGDSWEKRNVFKDFLGRIFTQATRRSAEKLVYIFYQTLFKKHESWERVTNQNTNRQNSVSFTPNNIQKIQQYVISNKWRWQQDHKSDITTWFASPTESWQLWSCLLECKILDTKSLFNFIKSFI